MLPRSPYGNRSYANVPQCHFIAHCLPCSACCQLAVSRCDTQNWMRLTLSSLDTDTFQRRKPRQGILISSCPPASASSAGCNNSNALCSKELEIRISQLRASNYVHCTGSWFHFATDNCTCIQEKPLSNLGRDNDYSDRFFAAFLSISKQMLQQYFG